MGYMRDVRGSRLDAFDPRRDLNGLTAWWDTSTLTGSSGTSIEVLHDLSGHGNDLVQNIASNRPAVLAGGLNGKRVLDYGASSALTSNVFGNANGFQPAGWPQPNTALIVAKLASGPAGFRTLIGGGAASGRQNLFVRTDGSLQLNAGGNGASGDRSFADDTWHIFAAVFDTTAGRIYVDGYLVAIGITQAHGAEAWTTVGLGSDAAGSNPIAGGQIAEAIICNSRLSSGQIGAATIALAQKWALS